MSGWNGRLRDPAVYLLALFAFGLGGGGGLLVGGEGGFAATRGEQLYLLRRQVEADARAADALGESEALRALVQGEIDRSLRPIERDLAEIRTELQRIHAKLDRAMAPYAPRNGPTQR